ncbi:hypothetical protein FVE85_7792 [Porphyridium purpureum]|uniref:SET domain-containing protein n=1 Tax=Porphyridium purpureum TaxID=35688 RepID=A0A5J4YIU5_PORPP|nr:hypothetical protein FVE85_7792 [Porphyridium purpureum]|eukprot:POR9500..scf210_14
MASASAPALAAEPGLRVQVTPNAGRSLYAALPFDDGDVLLAERPSWVMQSVESRQESAANGADVCGLCGTCARSFGHQIRATLQAPSADSVPRSPADDTKLVSELLQLLQSDAEDGAACVKTFACASASHGDRTCEQIYCSTACAERDWLAGHRMMCVSVNADLMSQLDELARGRYVCLRYAVDLLVRVAAVATSEPTANVLECSWVAELEHRSEWSSSWQCSSGRRQKDAVKVRRAACIATGMCGRHVSEADVERVLTALDINAVSVQLSSGIYSRMHAWLRNSAQHAVLDCSESELPSALGELISRVEIRMGLRPQYASGKLDASKYTVAQLAATLTCLFPPTEFIALHRTVSLLNHSCRPNVRLEHRLVSAETEVAPAGIETRAIAMSCENDCEAAIRPDDELTISYIDASIDDTPVRQQLLAPYGFVCGCTKCG